MARSDTLSTDFEMVRSSVTENEIGVMTMMALSDERKREIERLKNVVIKRHWASDAFAQSTAIDVIATYGIAAIPALIEISQHTVGLTRQHALDRITHLNSPNSNLSQTH